MVGMMGILGLDGRGGGGGGGGYTFLKNVKGIPASSGLDAITAGIDTTGANLIVIQTSYYFTGTSVLSDSKLNTWTALTLRSSGTGSRCLLYFCFNPTTDVSHTFKLTSVSSNAPALAVLAFSGAGASPFDLEGGTGGTSAAAAPGTVTPTNDNELVVCGMGNGFAGSSGIGPTGVITGSFNVTDTASTQININQGIGMAYLIQTSKAAANPSYTISASDAWSCGIACFK